MSNLEYRKGRTRAEIDLPSLSWFWVLLKSSLNQTEQGFQFSKVIFLYPAQLQFWYACIGHIFFPNKVVGIC